MTTGNSYAAGPFDLLTASDWTEFGGHIVWSKALGGGVLAVQVDDNISSSSYFTTAANFLVGVDVRVIGRVCGIPYLLRSQLVRQVSGPLLHRFAREEAYESIRLEGRANFGGLQSAPSVLYMRASVSISERLA